MDNLVDQIIKGEESVYLVQGSEDLKEKLKENIKETIDVCYYIKEIPEKILESQIVDDGSQFKEYIDIITVGILIADFLIIYLDNLDNVYGGRIKEIVSEEFFEPFYYLMDRENGPSRKRQLIIVSETDFNNSIFTLDPGLKARCKFC